jgi:Amt family ammonium transporter
MLTSVALVLMMTIPGLALFYGGMVRKKNVLDTVMQSIMVTCLVTVLYTIVTYSMAFTTGSPYLGGMSRFLLMGMTLDRSTAWRRRSQIGLHVLSDDLAIITPA